MRKTKGLVPEAHNQNPFPESLVPPKALTSQRTYEKWMAANPPDADSQKIYIDRKRARFLHEEGIRAYQYLLDSLPKRSPRGRASTDEKFDLFKRIIERQSRIETERVRAFIEQERRAGRAPKTKREYLEILDRFEKSGKLRGALARAIREEADTIQREADAAGRKPKEPDAIEETIRQSLKRLRREGRSYPNRRSRIL